MTTKVLARVTPGTTPKRIVLPYARHNGEIKQVQQIWARRPNGQVELLWPIIQQVTVSATAFEASTQGPVSASVFFGTTGNITVSPLGQGANSLYTNADFVRFTQVNWSDNGTLNTPTLGTWLPLNLTRSVSVTATGGFTNVSWFGTAEISTTNSEAGKFAEVSLSLSAYFET